MLTGVAQGRPRVGSGDGSVLKDVDSEKSLVDQIGLIEFCGCLALVFPDVIYRQPRHRLGARDDFVVVVVVVVCVYGGAAVCACVCFRPVGQ